ncbi:MAG: type VI secretion system baseplate subunit TssF [Longimicrobiales bacterium]
MRDELLEYYEQELTFLRQSGAEFARRYPKIAGRLLLEDNKCDDPHVERLLEGFALLAARVHLKINDDFPEISEALLNVVYPHYIRPVPALSLVQFHLDREQGKLTGGHVVPRGALLYSRAVAGTPCKFQTCYETVVWPITVNAARWLTPHELQPPVRSATAVAALRIELQCLPDVRFSALDLKALRLHINAEPNLSAALYELLCCNCVSILMRDLTPGSRAAPVVLEPSALVPVGFGEDEGVFPHPRRSFLGYRLLQEYFVFPEKFYFLDLTGFDRVRAAGFGDKMEVVFLIRSFERTDWRALLEAGIKADTFRLGAAPVVNLFPQTSEPVVLTHKQPEYLVVPDARRRAVTSIYSVEDVVAVSPGSAEPLRFEPFYSFRHDRSSSRGRMFWYARRRPTAWSPSEGTDVYLSFVDQSSRTVYPDLDAVTVRLMCFNADLPSRLPFRDPQGDFELPGGGPITRITALINPTPVQQPPLGKPQLWRLISQLALNYVSILEGGADALRELLRLHNSANSLAGEKQIFGISQVRGAPCYARIAGEHGITFARGHRIEIDFDEDQFVGGSLYLLASVLERFLGMSVSLNSFSVLEARSLKRKEPIKAWPPRAGFKALL